MYSTLTSINRRNCGWKFCNIFLVLLSVTFFVVIWKRYQSERQIVKTQVYSVGQTEGLEWKVQQIQKEQEQEASADRLLSENFNERQIRKVVLGSVSCRNKNTTDPRNSTILNYSDGTVVMIKSVLISAKLYNISAVDLHLFLEHSEDEEYFVEKLKEMGYPFSGIDFQLFVHSAVDVVPEIYRDNMVYHPRYRCGYVRFFFPSALPNVYSIIHLDSDMIITGNLWEIWNTFSQFQGEQLIGAARANEVNDTHYLGMHIRWFGDIPHPPPKGVNAGLLVMNLTKMRDYNWENKFLRVYEEYSKKVILTGQRTCNILLSADPGILKMLSCQFNFFHRHCDKGFTCTDAAEKNGRIYLVHGNGFKMEQGELFYPLVKGYREFDFASLNKYNAEDKYEIVVSTVKTSLMTPIRKEFSLADCSKCHGVFNHLLYRDFFNGNFTIGELSL